MRVYLEIGSKHGQTKRVALTADAVIGRGSSSNLRIGSDKVSRKHCLLTIADTGVMLRDLGSMNGTFVNGYRLQPNQDVSVGPSTKLVIGPAQFVIQFGPEYEASLDHQPAETAQPESPASDLQPVIQAAVDAEKPTSPQAHPPLVAESVAAPVPEQPPVINIPSPNGNSESLLNNLILNESIASDETVDIQGVDQQNDLQATHGEEFSGDLAPESPASVPDQAAPPLQEAPLPPPDHADDGDDSLNDFLSALE